MALHYLDPEQEPRACPECNGEGEACFEQPLIGERWIQCNRCSGSGRLGNPDAKRVETIRITGGEGRYWQWRAIGDAITDGTHYPTEAAALAAARGEAR